MMGWETRGNGRYYYRKRWVNGRPVSEYIGGGDIGELCALSDGLERHERNMAAAAWRAMVESERDADRVLGDVETLTRAITSAVLIACGYHAHRRQWRRERR